MSRIEVKHQGFTIIYGENSDMWECYALQMEAKTLSKIKTMINAHVKRVIKNTGLVFGHRQYGSGGPTKVTMTSRDANSGNFWVVSEDGSRRLAKVSELCYWTDDIDDKMAQIKALQFEGRQLENRRREIEQSIKSFSGEDLDKVIADLVSRIAVDE